ncbi:fragile X mental retardation 1 neighbor protein [Myotis myotis]|uniref:fragile X mental retardation 1 neighbor protein n=1 Tax=Myotis myotis TaxID=51298 RepID=UPI00174A4AB9|nr:fragile X mental retardation 1 neighbor protein [Myotis myotis]
MPSEGRCSRGKTRPRNKALKGARIRLVRCDESYAAENPVVRSHLSDSIDLGRHPIMAATPQPGWQASLRGLGAERRRSLMNMWAKNRLVLFLLTILVMTLLCYHLGFNFSNSVTENEYILWSSENPNGKSLEKTYVRRALISFFFPTTCIVKENQEVEACNNLPNLNKSACLEYRCCYSSFGTKNFSCFAPLSNKPLQIFRMFGFCVISMIILGCLPIYCFSLHCRSKWIYPLRRKAKRIFKKLKKQRNKLKRDAEMLRAAIENEEGLSEDKEQEDEA